MIALALIDASEEGDRRPLEEYLEIEYFYNGLLSRNERRPMTRCTEEQLSKMYPIVKEQDAWE